MELFISANSNEYQEVLQNYDGADDDEDDVEWAVPISAITGLHVIQAQVFGTAIVQCDETFAVVLRVFALCWVINA